MKKIIALTIVLLAVQAIAVFAGEPQVSSKEVVTPPPPPSPPSYFRPNEFDLGVFATYVTGTGSGTTRSRTDDFGDTLSLHSNGSSSGWGGGLDFTYWFGWKYIGLRAQGAGVDL